MIRLSGPVRGIGSILIIISRVELWHLQGSRVLVVGISKWLKSKLIRGNRPDVPSKWSGNLIQGYVYNFRRRVVRVWPQMACRADSQSDKHYLWKPNCPWMDATNRWTTSRHCASVTCPIGFTERCCCCTFCRKHGRWKREYLKGLAIIRHFSPKDHLFSACPSRRL